MISTQLAAEIRRLHQVEGWRKHTIARQLGVHHSTVARVVSQAGLERKERPRRASMMDRFVPFIEKTFQRYPDLPASVVYAMVKKRGYPGGPDYFRHRVRKLGLRPRKAPEAFFVLRTLPGEQAQVDWAHFGTRKVDGGERKLYAFVMVLSYSRALFFRFFHEARLPSFLTGHVEAFAFFGGLAKVHLYDNLASAVRERRGRAIVFHPRMLELADHYGFDPRPVAPRRGNEKGRVERAIRFLRTSFYPLRSTCDLATLNREARSWCREQAMTRPWPQDRRRTVEQAYLEERRHLLPVPEEPFLCHEWIAARPRRSPYVTLDTNRYSIPHDRVARSLMIAAEVDRVRVFDQEELIAEHARSWDKGAIVENPGHLEKLRREKRAARRQIDRDRLIRSVPEAEKLLIALGRRQRRLSSAVTRLLELLAEVGAPELSSAITEALERGSPHPESVRFVLDRRRHEKGLAPAVPVKLPKDPRVRDLVVTPHSLADYDLNDEETDDAE